MVRQKDPCNATRPTPHGEVNTYIDKNANACYSIYMSRNTNTRIPPLKKRVLAGAAASATIFGIAAVTAQHSKEGVDCSVPIVRNLNHTVDIVNNAGGDAVDAEVVDHNGVLLDKLSRSYQEDGSLTVVNGDVLKGAQLPDKVVCDAIIKLALENNQGQ